jgi:hypothetical protein
MQRFLNGAIFSGCLPKYPVLTSSNRAKRLANLTRREGPGSAAGKSETYLKQKKELLRILYKRGI